MCTNALAAFVTGYLPSSPVYPHIQVLPQSRMLTLLYKKLLSKSLASLLIIHSLNADADGCRFYEGLGVLSTATRALVVS